MKLYITLFTIIALAICTLAVPVRDSLTRKVTKHHSRRNVDIIMNARLSSGIRETHRYRLLQTLLARTSGSRSISMKIYPSPEDIPSRRDIALDLLSRINDHNARGNIRVRVAPHEPDRTRLQHLAREAEKLKQSTILAKTCDELRRTILQMQSIRVKVKCRSDPPQTASANHPSDNERKS